MTQDHLTAEHLATHTNGGLENRLMFRSAAGHSIENRKGLPLVGSNVHCLQRSLTQKRHVDTHRQNQIVRSWNEARPYSFIVGSNVAPVSPHPATILATSIPAKKASPHNAERLRAQRMEGGGAPRATLTRLCYRYNVSVE